MTDDCGDHSWLAGRASAHAGFLLPVRRRGAGRRHHPGGLRPVASRGLPSGRPAGTGSGCGRRSLAEPRLERFGWRRSLPEAAGRYALRAGVGRFGRPSLPGRGLRRRPARRPSARRRVVAAVVGDRCGVGPRRPGGRVVCGRRGTSVRRNPAGGRKMFPQKVVAFGHGVNPRPDWVFMVSSGECRCLRVHCVRRLAQRGRVHGACQGVVLRHRVGPAERRSGGEHPDQRPRCLSRHGRSKCPAPAACRRPAKSRTARPWSLIHHMDSRLVASGAAPVVITRLVAPGRHIYLVGLDARGCPVVLDQSQQPVVRPDRDGQPLAGQHDGSPRRDRSSPSTSSGT